MGKTKKEKTTLKSRLEGLKTEFSKIVWLDKKTTGKQTFAVILVTVIVGAIIAVLDMGIQYGVNLLTNL